MLDGADSGRISRRSLLIGGASAATALAVGGGAFGYEVHHSAGLRVRLFGCGSTPAIPRSTYTVTTGTTASTAMGTTEPWLVALPASHKPGEPLPLVLVLPGLNGQPTMLTTGVGLPGFATAAGLTLAFACPGGAGTTYYHPRASGTDAFAWVTEEFLPMIEQRFGVGGSKAQRGVFGWSMGGAGALLIAVKRPDLVSAVVGSSPAVFPSYDAAVTGHPDTFDSRSDWAQWGVWNQAAGVRDVAVRIDCGDDDPFAPTARALLAKIPGAVGQIESGCHLDSFWRRNAATQLQFLAAHLGESVATP